MPNILHTQEQGLRVHYLANLGGLVAIAGLEDIEPDVLLGALIEINVRLRNLSQQRLSELKQKGFKALQERNAEKRSFNSWRNANKSERFDLTETQIKQLIVKLGGKLPALEKDFVPELNRLLRALNG